MKAVKYPAILVPRGRAPCGQHQESLSKRSAAGAASGDENDILPETKKLREKK